MRLSGIFPALGQLQWERFNLSWGHALAKQPLLHKAAHTFPLTVQHSLLVQLWPPSPGTGGKDTHEAMVHLTSRARSGNSQKEKTEQSWMKKCVSWSTWQYGVSKCHPSHMRTRFTPHHSTRQNYRNTENYRNNQWSENVLPLLQEQATESFSPRAYGVFF